MQGTNTLFEGEIMDAYRPTLQTDGAGSDGGANLPPVADGDGGEMFYNRDEADRTMREIAEAAAAVNNRRMPSRQFLELTGITMLHEVTKPEPLRTHPLHLSPQILGVEGDHTYN